MRAKGIRKTSTGFRCYVRAAGVLRCKRFPPDTALSVMKAWRDETRVALRLITPVRVVPGGFRAEVATYLAAVRTMPTFAERQKHLEEWVARFGDRPRNSIQPIEIRTALQELRAQGKAASSINHRRTALMHFWSVIAPTEPNLVRLVPRMRPPEPEPRGIPPELMRRILDAMPDHGTAAKGQPREGHSKAKARLAVHAWTGLPPAQIMHLRPEDVDWEGRTLLVPPRRKGQGVARSRRPLTKKGLAALRAFAKADAWGPYSTSVVRRAFRAACEVVEAEFREAGRSLDLSRLRPYDARHGLGASAYLATGDVQAVAELLGQTDLRTTRRYTLSGVDEALRHAVTQLDRIQARKLPKKLPRAKTGRRR